MPIHGFRRQDVGERRWNTLGKLKKGRPKSQGLGDLEYFRFDSENAEAVAEFERIYGPEPDRFAKVYFPFNEMEQNFTCWREQYGQNGLCKLRCDGANIVDWIEGNRHFHGSRPCNKQWLDTENRCPGCPVKQIGRLTLIFPELWQAGYAGYFVTLETHSWNDIATIVGKLTQYEPLTNRPFTLWREDTRIGVPIKDKRAVVEKSLIKLSLQDEWILDEWSAANERTAAAQLVAEVPVPDDWEEIAGREASFQEEDVLAAYEAEFDDAFDPVEDEPPAPIKLQGVGKNPADLVAKGKVAMAEQPTVPDKAPDGPHWANSPATGPGFFAWLKKNGWTPEDAKLALQVESFLDYTGSLGEAKTTLYNYSRD